MYTSRTPYHGLYEPDRNDTSVQPVVNWYTNAEQSSIGPQLRELGRLPEKDMIGFETMVVRTEAYRTQVNDAEYLTRQEMLDQRNREEFGGGTPGHSSQIIRC